MRERALIRDPVCPQGGEAGGDDSSVDTVLAALVDYSKDPKLWRFVHSVVGKCGSPWRARPQPKHKLYFQFPRDFVRVLYSFAVRSVGGTWPPRRVILKHAR